MNTSIGGQPSSVARLMASGAWRGAVACGLVLFFLLHVLFVYLNEPELSSLLAVVPVLGIAATAAWFRFSRFRLGRFAGAVAILQTGVFIYILTTELRSEARLAAIALILIYAGGLLTLIIVKCRLMEVANAVLLVSSGLVTLFIGELCMTVLYDAPVAVASDRTEVKWRGDVREHPEFGWYYPPYGNVRIYYPDNPRGYFDESNDDWLLSVYGSSVGKLLRSEREARVMKVEIDRADSTPWHISLVQYDLALAPGEVYRLSLRVRAEAERTIIVALSQDHEPWQHLGLYEEIEVGKEWRQVEKTFTLAQSDRIAKLQFNLGGSEAAVEIGDVRVLQVSSGQRIDPPRKYFVSYLFNDHGCRGRDYVVPKPDGVFRILTLGDSYALGVGVHERDVLTSRLEEFLDERSDTSESPSLRYEVINCGVSGFATREERIFFETIAADYRPDLVLLLPVWNDDMSWADEVKAGLIDTGSRPQPLFAAQGLVERARRERTYDYTRSMDELLRLDALVRQQGARLVVAPFRNEESAPWDGLLQALAATLRGTDIPYHDLGPALLRDPGRDLKVHPIDGHPNEVAHRLAAEELLQFLQAQHLLP